jgi:alpha-amylase
MLLMVDVAPNHMGSGPRATIKYEDYVPWNASRYFHPPRFNIRYDPPNQTEIEQFWIGQETGIALPDLNTEMPEVYNTLYLWIHQLVKTYGIDGLRLDTVKHIRKSFWPQFCKHAGVFAIGEVLHGGFESVPDCRRKLTIVTWVHTRTLSPDCWTMPLTFRLFGHLQGQDRCGICMILSFNCLTSLLT